VKRDVTPALTLAPQQISLDVLREKYLKPGEETSMDLFRRVARSLASAEPQAERALWEERFLVNLQAGAIGAGRIMSAAGTALSATLINCFVQPVGDCIQGQDDEGYPGIYEALREAAETMRRGGGVGDRRCNRGLRNRQSRRRECQLRGRLWHDPKEARAILPARQRPDRQPRSGDEQQRGKTDFISGLRERKRIELARETSQHV